MELHLETNDTSLELLLPRIKEHTDAKKKKSYFQNFVHRKNVEMKRVLQFL